LWLLREANFGEDVKSVSFLGLFASRGFDTSKKSVHFCAGARKFQACHPNTARSFARLQISPVGNWLLIGIESFQNAEGPIFRTENWAFPEPSR
jgi:hypothetical protein